MSKETKKDRVKKMKVKKEFEFTLTDKDILEKSANASSLNEKLKEKLREFDGVKKVFSGQIKELKTELDNELMKIQTRKETKVCEAEEVYNYETGDLTVLIKGKTHLVRPMTINEKQMFMDIVSESPKAAKVGAIGKAINKAKKTKEEKEKELKKELEYINAKQTNGVMSQETSTLNQ
jgi:hypothetical protein